MLNRDLAIEVQLKLDGRTNYFNIIADKPIAYHNGSLCFVSSRFCTEPLLYLVNKKFPDGYLTVCTLHSPKLLAPINPVPGSQWEIF